jgi:hypothetical protein
VTGDADTGDADTGDTDTGSAPDEISGSLSKPAVLLLGSLSAGVSALDVALMINRYGESTTPQFIGEAPLSPGRSLSLDEMG